MGKRKITIQIGALAKPLSEQLAKQGYRFAEAKTCSVFENYIHQLTCLMFGQLLTRAESDKIYNRLVKKIAMCVEEIDYRKQ